MTLKINGPDDPLLSVVKLHKSFYHHKVLNGITFNIRGAETVSIMGKNGVGKSTLLRIIARISAPDSGQILFKGQDLLNGPPETRKPLLYLGHHPALYPSLSAVENLTLALALRQLPENRERVISMLCELGLGNQMNDPIAIYSQGMLQRLKLALASLVDWELLLFDEPFAGLDAEGVERVNGFLCRWKKAGKGLVLVLHSLDRALEYCSRFLFLSDGNIGSDLQLDKTSEDDVKETFRTLLR